MESIHGHEVIEMIVSSGRPFTRSVLVAEIGGKFGPGARFHTCSAEGLTAEGLVEFLMAKGKFHITGDGMTIDPGKVCQH
jgi:probable metal-binding protein